MEFLPKSFTDCEDCSACLSYDGTDAPTAEGDRDRILGMHVMHKSFTDCEDRSACLSYDGTDAPTAESDRDRILGRPVRACQGVFCINHLQIVKTAVAVYCTMIQAESDRDRILGKTFECILLGYSIFLVVSVIYMLNKNSLAVKNARPIRSHNSYKRPKTLISSKAKKLNILLRILLL